MIHSIDLFFAFAQKQQQAYRRVRLLLFSLQAIF